MLRYETYAHKYCSFRQNPIPGRENVVIFRVYLVYYGALPFDNLT